MKKIKVAQVITRMIVGGAQENTLYTCRTLARDPRFEVTLITGPGLGPEGSLLEELKPNENFKLVLLNQLRREINPLRDIFVFFQLYCLFRKVKFQVLHTHSSKAGILGRWSGWLAQIPVRLHTFHGWGFHDKQTLFFRRLYILLERLSAKITTRLITVSQQNTEKGLSKKIGKSSQYLTIYSGIDLNRFMPIKGDKKGTLNISDNTVVIGTIGRLTEQKNPLLFVRMASSLLKKKDDLYFLFVGDGPLRQVVEREIERLHLNGRVKLAGLKKDVIPWLACMDIFVLPSAWEGLPRVLLQAMSMEKPVIASKTDGILEIIKDKQNGRLLESRDPQIWTQAVLELLENPRKSNRYIKEAKQMLSSKFSDVNMGEELKELMVSFFQE